MRIILLLLSITLFITAKTVPSAIWHQKDIAPFTVGDSTASQKILIVSRKGSFKEAVTKEIADSLAINSFYIEVGGIKKLKKVNPANYKAIVIINTCMAWQVDNKVQSFFKKNQDYRSIILITTSGDPNECGKGKEIPEEIDEISSASTTEKVKPVVTEALAKLKVILEK